MDAIVDGIVQPVLGRLDEVFAGEYAALVYGSAARGEYRAGVSDVNLLVVCRELDPDTLRRLSAALGGLHKAGQPPPLLMEREEWTRATDVFPIEVTDMQIARAVVRGEDPAAGLLVDPSDLRRALEAELRAKLLRLRQAFAIGGADPKLLGAAASGSIASIVTLLRVSLKLFGQAVPAGTPAVLAAAGAAMRVDTATLTDLWNRRRAGERSCPPTLFEDYLRTVAAAVRVTDQFTGGGN